MAEADEEYDAWVDECLGPQQVGGRYHCGYWNQGYTVVAIERGPREGWPVWQITVLGDGEERTRSHCTAWEPKRDRVLPAPDAEARP